MFVPSGVTTVNKIWMASDLFRALSELYIDHKREIEDDDYIDEKLTQQRPRKRTKQSHESLRKEIEKDFLSPPTSFGSEWLNRLQQHVTQVIVTVMH